MSALPVENSTFQFGQAASALSLVVGIGEFKLSRDPHGELITHALGSCLGITFHDPVRQVGGLLHAVLPSMRSQDAAEKRPTMFVDSGMRYALDELHRNGCRQTDIRCKVFGGAEVTEAESFFRVGANNSHAFCQISRELGLNVTAWEIGGRANRTICLFNRTGDVTVQAPNRPEFTR